MAKRNSKTVDQSSDEGGAPVQPEGVGILRKITIRDVIGKARQLQLAAELAQAKGRKVALCQIYGTVARAKPGTTDKGEYIKLVGSFKGINLATGEVMRSNAAILPNFIGEQIFAAMAESEASVNFAVEIGAHYDESAITKYVYDVKTLMPPAESSAVAAIEAQLGRKLALPAPSAA
jgi:hypothetical protein